jgi:hypothetical protein
MSINLEELINVLYKHKEITQPNCNHILITCFINIILGIIGYRMLKKSHNYTYGNYTGNLGAFAQFIICGFLLIFGGGLLLSSILNPLVEISHCNSI